MGVKRFKVKSIGRHSGVVHEFITTVDEDDAHLLRSSYWRVTNSTALNADGIKENRKYIKRETASGTQTLHQLIVGAGPAEKVWHINGDSLDNRKCNLMKQSDRVEEIID